MNTNRKDVIEPEIIDETGQNISPVQPAKDHARPKGDTGGLIGGFFVLAFGFIMTLLVAVFSILVVLPLMLIGRLLGIQVRTFRR
jgi:predicted lipid-binding transport protein (Tim44 family)